MKILWITNVLFPEVCKKLDIPAPVVGGWLISGANNLIKFNNDIILAIAILYNGNDYKYLEINNIKYYLIPRHNSNRTYDKKLEKYFVNIKSEFIPDIIHIHGTEYPGLLAYIKTCGNDNVIVSIQGLISIIAKEYLGGIQKNIILKKTTLRDVIRLDTIFNQQQSIKQRSTYEKELIRSVNYLIGRTNWDRLQTQIINPIAHYFKCDETLRDEFYTEDIWNFENCDKHSIFISQGYYPIKGLHQVIKALPLIIKRYPNAKVFVAGNDFFSKPFWRLNGYGKFIKDMIEEYNLKNRIIFTGILTAEVMKKRYLKSNIFVCPSAIENSPNSIGEAQILGVPCVVSNVGGVGDMVEDGVTGLLYEFENIKKLANLVCNIFGEEELAKRISINGRSSALKRHDRITNARTLNNIYSSLCKN
jgi:glycosyltransferase involved in cell wall biosynthesis